MWIIVAIVGVALILFLFVGNKTISHNNLFLFNKWKELSSSLIRNGISPTSQIQIDSIHFVKGQKDYIPEKIISIDSQSKKIVVSYIANIKKDEKSNIVSCDFQHDILAFNQIKGGKIIELGESAKSVGTAVGSQLGSTSLVGGISSSNITNYIEKLEYNIKLDNIDNPEYTITFIDRKEAKTSLWYERHYKGVEKFNSIIENIVKKNDTKE